MIRVLIVDDSPTLRALLRAIMGEDPRLQVIGEASNGREAVFMAKELRPDLITMDVLMPEMDGLEATKEIMIEAPTRIVIVSGHLDRREVNGSLQALRLGALTVFHKPPSPQDPQFAGYRQELVRMVKSMAEVKVVRHWRDRPARFQGRPQPDTGPRRRFQAVAIASSTGGPAALRYLLGALPENYPLPILIVQHMPVGFTQGLADWLNLSSPLSVRVAEADDMLTAGTAYLAPEGRHLGVAPSGDQVLLSRTPAIEGFCPSATFLFESVARALGRSARGVILTGMGRDGVDGLRVLKEAGGRVVAQDEATSIVYGMPREAVVAGLADAVLPLDAIPLELMEMAPYERAVK